MNKHGAIGARELETGEVTIHADCDPGANYHTLCAISLDDDQFERVEIPERARITCEHCYSLWKTAKLFKARDFDIRTISRSGGQP